MEARNLIKFGNSSYVISLPKEWVDKNNLKKGDSVFIERNGNEELIIVPQIKETLEPDKEITIDISNKNYSQIKRVIISSYMNNFKLVKITGKDLNKNKEDVKRVVKELTALEIIEENDKEIIVKDFLNIKDVSIHLLLRKQDNLIRSMIYDLKNFNNAFADDIIERDREVNKIQYLILRTLKYSFDNPATLKSLNFDEHKQFLNLWDICIILEKIADEIKRIARRFKKLECGNKIRLQLKLVAEKIENFYNQTMKSYYNNDNELALSLSSSKKEIAGQCNLLSEKYWSIKGISEIIENYKDIVASIHNIGRRIYTN